MEMYVGVEQALDYTHTHTDKQMFSHVISDRLRYN